MSDYRRLISYIYAYDKDVKGHSVGFAKLESRNGQCKISVSVKKLYMGNAEWNVYLLSGEQEIPIGRFYIRGQGGEFRTIVQAENVERSGYPLSAMHGLSIHGENSESRYYMTIWEEPNVHAAELEVEGELQAAEEPKVAEQPSLTAYVPDAFQMDGGAINQPGILENSLYAPSQEAQESENDASKMEAPADGEQQAQEMENPSDGVEYPDSESAGGLEIAADPQILMEPEGMAEALPYAGNLPEAKDQPGQNDLRDSNTQVNSESTPDAGSMAEPEELQDMADDGMEPELMPEPAGAQSADSDVIGERRPEESNWQVYAQTASRGQLPLWEKLRKRYAKIQAFDYAGGCEILTIKPQDIGLLPRENWVYGNNSFLLHAYYNYRYLILVKLDEPDGSSRYLLGVPGMYYTNEKYMASMFGFPEFILAKKQPHKDGRFGYWYAEVKI